MSEHRTETQPGKTKTEPAAIAEAVRLVLLALAGAGLITLDDALLATIVSIAGVVASIALTWWTRTKVTPTAKPRATDGTSLVPTAPTSTLRHPPPNEPPPVTP